MSIQTVKSRLPGQEPTYYENLIQITIKDDTNIFEICDESVKEVNFLLKMEQFNDPEKYVSSGTSQ